MLEINDEVVQYKYPGFYCGLQKGKTLEELYGRERAKKIKLKNSLSQKNRKSEHP